MQTYSSSASRSSLDTEAKSLHAAPVFRHHILTLLDRIIGIREKHAFVASGLFVFAYATGLLGVSRRSRVFWNLIVDQPLFLLLHHRRA